MKINKNFFKEIILAFLIMAIVSTISFINVNHESKKIETAAQKLYDEKIKKEAKNVKPKIITEENIKKQSQIREIYIVTASKLNVRGNPSIEAKKVSAYYRNQIIEVIDKQGVWYKTELGFVHSNYLISMNSHNERIVNSVSRSNIIVSRSGDVSRNNILSITNKSNLSISDLQKLTEGTDLKGIEQALLDIENKYSINSLFTLAVAKLESGNGTSRISKYKNNIFGINAISGNAFNSAFNYNSKSECVYAFGDLIFNKYLNKGRTTIQKINQKYCPGNNKWSTNVLSIMKKDYAKVKT